MLPKAPSSPWIRRFHPAPEAGNRLVFFPHAGGSASFFFPASRMLAPSVDVLVVQYPGRQDRRREACVDDMDLLSELVAAELLPWADRPLGLFGHSLGATLAFEVARRLEHEGVQLLGVFASGRRAPAHQREEAMHLLDDDTLIKAMKLLAGNELEIPDDDELLRSTLSAVRSDYKAVETYRYRPGPLLSSPIVAMTGDNDPKVTPREAEAWAQYTTGTFELRVFEGAHFYLVRHMEQVTEVLRMALS